MLAPAVMRRLAREVARLQRSPPDGLAIEVGEQDMLSIDGWIQGPAGTPYAGGFFRVHFTFAGSDFPAGPPKCTMKSKIFHPNIHAGSGEICVSTLKKDWSPTYGIEHILTVIKCLLISPNADSALDPEAARLLQDTYEEYAATAAIWTRVHASRRPACLPETSSPLPSPLSRSSLSPLADEHVAKKVDVQATTADISSLSLSSTSGSSGSGLAFSSQPLARSGSTNINLHHKPSFDNHAGRTSTSGSASTRLTPSVSSTTLDGRSATNVIAATATAAAAAMTAAITADLCGITLEDRSASAAATYATMIPAKVTTNSKRPPTVRRGIKRL